MVQIKIKNRIVGQNQPPFIVAEAGINHNGEIEKALKMIQIAKESNVDAIKFQTFKAEEFIANPKQMITYRSQAKQITESMLELHKRLEFSRDEWFRIKKHCDDEGIIFFSTAQNRSDLDLLLEIGIEIIKVGSDDFNNLPLLKDYTATGLPIFISCGMADLEEIRETLQVIGALEGYPTVLLLCTSQYPTPPEDVNLLKFKTITKTFPGISLGFSDHTQGPLASSLAVAFGACVFEKHFTLDHNLPGPDHWFAEDPTGLKEWIDSIRKASIMMGSRIVHPTKLEEINKKEWRRVVVANREIKEGEIFDTTNINMKRVSGGNGLPPSFYEKILGKRAIKKFNYGEPIII
ncbi:MAG: N-acetylneuraminate synthase family protein [Nitrosarchaeum sp.]